MSRAYVAFDTSTEAIAVGVALVESDDSVRIEGGCRLAPRQANALLLESLVRTLESLGLGVDDIGGIVVGRGPGSFTGVRIGVAAAKGLAQGLGVPLVGVGTLDAVAWRLADHSGLVGVLGDAMRGEVYPALFRAQSGAVTRLSEDRVAAPDEVAAEWAASIREPITLTGNGLAKYANVFTDALGAQASVAPEDRWWPDGASLLRAFFAAGGPALFPAGDPATLLPVYTRLSDAEEAERARRGEVDGGTPASGVVGDSGAAEEGVR